MGYTVALKSWVEDLFASLGNSSGRNVGTAAGTVAAGDDPRITSLSSTYGALPEAYIDPRGMADGAVASLSKGTFVASYGNSPAVITAGQIAHTPTAGANTAAYIETLLSGPARRIGAMIDWGAAGDGTAAVVIPAASWAAGIGNAGVHCTVTAAGVVSCGRYVSGATAGTQTTNVGALTGRHALEVGIDSTLQQITVWLDGARVLRYTDAAAFTYLSNRAIWELYEPNGTSNVPCVLRSTWADVERIIPTAIPFDDVQPIRKAYANNNSSAASIAIPTTYRAVLGIGTLSVYFPPSGRLLCRYRVMLTANGLTNTRRVFGSIASAADQALCYGGYVGPVTCEMVVTGTPGALRVLSPQMWAEDASGTVTATISATTGVSVITATPLEAVVA